MSGKILRNTDLVIRDEFPVPIIIADEIRYTSVFNFCTDKIQIEIQLGELFYAIRFEQVMSDVSEDIIVVG